MPCTGTPQCELLYSEILLELQAVITENADCDCLIGGDFNVDLNSHSKVSQTANEFMRFNDVHRCDVQFPVSNRNTYINDSTNACSAIDYFVSSNRSKIVAFNVLDIDINLSDHVPLLAVCLCDPPNVCNRPNSSRQAADVAHLRWDHAPLEHYYEHTRLLLEPILESINNLLENCDIESEAAVRNVDQIYNNVVDVLRESANLFIPKHKKSFFKFWWSQELDIFKQKAIASCRTWKDAGKPKHGTIFAQYKQDKLLYKKRIREERASETICYCYSNDLHDALLCKSGPDFWKVWNSKFESKSSRVIQVDGTADGGLIAEKFAKYFESNCTPFSNRRNDELHAKYVERRSQYEGSPIAENDQFDVELIDNLIKKMSNGKAAGLDELSCEHLKHSHPILICILTKLFNFFISTGHVPASFGASYTVPIPKCDGRTHALTVDDFRGISISPVLSKLFELSIIARFPYYFTTSDHQFGFKKNLGCRHAIYCVRNVVESFVTNGSTVNICALDLSKAFDRMNHYALFLKLMDRNIPTNLLSILEMWFAISKTCVKWQNYVSEFFKLAAGVRQGGVLSPLLFAIFIDDIVVRVQEANVGCYISTVCASIFIYADDIYY